MARKDSDDIGKSNYWKRKITNKYVITHTFPFLELLKII